MSLVSPRSKWFLAGLALVTIWFFVLRSSDQYASVREYIHTETYHETVTVPEDASNSSDSKSSQRLAQDQNIQSLSHGSSIEESAQFCHDLGFKLPVKETSNSAPTSAPAPATSSAFLTPIVTTAPEDRPLILYAYTESEFGRRNLEYFLEHGIHDAADFVFLLNGDTDVDKLIFPTNETGPTTSSAETKTPEASTDPSAEDGPATPEIGAVQRDEEQQGEGNVEEQAAREKSEAEARARERVEAAAALKAKIASVNLALHPRSNIRIVRRPNTCYDLGAHAEVLNSAGRGEGWHDMNGPIKSDHGAAETLLRNSYKHYILMNASIRGPFIPPFSNTCWSSAYLSRLTKSVKLVGMSYNCNFGRGHVQSMIWATDSIGLQELLKPEAVGVCFEKMTDAMEAEIHTTKFIRDQGYEVDVFLGVYQSQNLATKTEKYDSLAAFKQTILESKSDTLPAVLAKELQAEERRLDAVMDKKPGRWWHDGCEAQTSDFLYKDGYYGTIIHPYENLFFKSHRHIDDNILDLYTAWADGAGYTGYDYCK